MWRAVLLLVTGAIIAPGCEHGDATETRADPLAQRRRDEALRSARVWLPPATPIPQVNLSENPAGPRGLKSNETLSCRFVLTNVNGTTPKFECMLPDGEVVKVKYGGTNPEIHAEVAATRLMAALGFGADRMYVVRSVQCAGCPAFPFESLKCHERTGLLRGCFGGGIDYSRVATFNPAVVERQMEGRKIEAPGISGWAWYELDRIDPSAGGSPRAEVDALRLMAIFLAHWDNKAENQRLVCLPGGDRPDGGCTKPFAFIQDVGATFGPSKLDLITWRRTPIWTDRSTCIVSMTNLPFGGATFPQTRISETGRQMLGRMLGELSERQLTDLFTTSRIITFDEITSESRNAALWVQAFQDKVRQIRDGAPCPQMP